MTRWMMQIFTMLGDILFFAAMGILVYNTHFNILMLLVVAFGFRVWWKQGALETWTPKGIRSFMTNAKKVGL